MARNTKALVAKVGTERMSLLPKVTSHILEAMDRVSHECKDTFASIVNNNNNGGGSFNGKSRTTLAAANGCNDEELDKHRVLFHKLEVSDQAYNAHFLKKWAIPGLFFFIFVFSIQLIVNT